MPRRFYRTYMPGSVLSTRQLPQNVDNTKRSEDRYGFRKIETIKTGSAMTDDVRVLIEEIQRYAGNRAQDVTRGAETPALAALMVEKFGEGLVKAGYLLGVERADGLKHEIDRLVREIDVQYPKHLQCRFEARPAGLAINGTAH